MIGEIVTGQNDNVAFRGNGVMPDQSIQRATQDNTGEVVVSEYNVLLG